MSVFDLRDVSDLHPSANPVTLSRITDADNRNECQYHRTKVTDRYSCLKAALGRGANWLEAIFSRDRSSLAWQIRITLTH